MNVNKLQTTDTKEANKFMDLALEAAQKSHCIRPDRRVGCIAVRDGKVIASGANGAFGKMKPCTALGYCIRTQKKITPGTNLEIENCVHAEQRVICEAARDGLSLKGCDIYVTHLPCAICTRLLCTTEVARVFYKYDYPCEISKQIAHDGGLQVVKVI
jgi:dCMP deaminase